ncbi:unnamed protein product [Bubo scandiacus]
MVPVGVLGLLLCLQLCRGTEDLRLVGGGGRCAGRVEVKHDGKWGSVCVYDFDWDARWATVVCQQLGCGLVARASSYAPFGQGTGQIWLQPFFCRGSETMLQDCPHFGWGKHFCGHERDAGVTCTDAVELRLAAGEGPCAGRVEVKLQGQWGSVGDDNWDINDAEVVCQQLGCGSAARAYLANTRFSSGHGVISLALVDCRGDEAALWDCEIRGWGPYEGVHEFDTAVECQGFARLVGGDSACAGRLELRRGQAWTGVCEDSVDVEVARVVCRELGCGAVLAVPGPGRFEVGTGPLWQAGFKCAGTETLLATCTRQPPRSQDCAGPASIICSPYAGFRLADNSSDCAGRVEVEVGGDMGVPLCHWLGPARRPRPLPPPRLWPRRHRAPRRLLRWGGRAAAAGHLRLHRERAAPGRVPHGSAGGARLPPWLRRRRQLLSPEEVAIVCSGGRRVRLAGGPGRCTGRVEVYVNGTWGTVCQENWDMPDAAVVCRQLGCGTALAALGSARFGPGMGPLWPDAGSCAGTEASLWDCPTSAWRDCQRGGGAGVVCSGQAALPAAGGWQQTVQWAPGGALQRHLGPRVHQRHQPHHCRCCLLAAGLWEHGESGSCPPARTQPPPGWPGWAVRRGARSLWQCRSAPWHLQACSPGRDAYVACDRDPDGTSGMPTLSPGSRCTDGATCTDVPSTTTPAAAAGTVPVPTVLCVVLGTLLCLALGALAVQVCRAWAQRRGPGRATDAISDAVYEELDYTLMPEYQEVQTRSGSPSEGSGMKLPYYTGDSMEESDPKAAPDSPAQHSLTDGYDDAAAVPEGSPAPGTGDISKGVAWRSWGLQPPGDTDYDDAGISTLGTSL